MKRALALVAIALLSAALAWVVGEGPRSGSPLAPVGRDFLFLARHVLDRDPALSDRIVLVAVDEPTVDAPELQKPLALWNRENAQVVTALAQGGAAVVALDFLQPYPGLTPEDDMVLMQALLGAPVVLAADVDEAGALRPPNPALFYAAGDPAEAGGLVRIARDVDGSVRSAALLHELQAPDGPITLLTLWFQGARRLLGLSAADVQAAWVGHGDRLSLAGRQVPLVDDSLLINYAGPAGTVPTVPYVEVLRHADAPAWLRERFDGRLVFVGVTARDQLDYGLTPMAWVQRLFGARGSVQVDDEMAGTEILAQAANTLVTGAFLTPAGAPLAWGFALVACLAGVLAGAAGAWRLPLLAAAVTATLAVPVGAFLQGLVLPVAWPLVGVFLAFAGGIGWRHVTTDAERARIRGLLGRYVSDRVAALVVDHPDQVALGGQSAEVTLLFSDLNHFTTWSEKTDPAEVVHTMNEYFTAMEEVIFREGGTLKQFVGDEIMVIFGAPFPQPDAEARAVRTALAMQRELEHLGEAWAARGIPRLQAKIGIHRGRVVVGNVGSPRRTEYAAVGDAVNLASRVMGLTKSLGHMVLITQDVYDRVRDLVEVREFPPQTVKGREAAVRVYGLDGLREDPLGSTAPPSAAP